LRIYVPRDAGAVAVGADAVAAALVQAGRSRGVEIDIIRTGSRGLYWLEPMVEIETRDGRLAYGPVSPGDASGLVDAALGGDGHPLRQGVVSDIPWLKRQTRLTFARCGVVDPRSFADYQAHGGGEGLAAAVALGAEATIEQVLQS